MFLPPCQVRMGKEHPDSINASITAFFFFREAEAELGRAPYVGFFDFFDHKYQMNIDGTVAAYRLPYLLAGNGVVFKQESEYQVVLKVPGIPGQSRYLEIRGCNTWNIPRIPGSDPGAFLLLAGGLGALHTRPEGPLRPAREDSVGPRPRQADIIIIIIKQE
jgi:hypothetical protein